MQIYWNQRKRLRKKTVHHPQYWFATPTSPPFHCFGTPMAAATSWENVLYTLSTKLMKPFQCQWHALDLFSVCNHWCCGIVHQVLRLSKSHETGFFSSPVCLYYHRWMHGKFNRYFHCCVWPKNTRVTILRTCWPRCIVVWISDRVCSLIW